MGKKSAKRVIKNEFGESTAITEAGELKFRHKKGATIFYQDNGSVVLKIGAGTYEALRYLVRHSSKQNILEGCVHLHLDPLFKEEADCRLSIG